MGEDENIHRVPKKQWKRWSDLAQKTFNGVFAGLEDQDLIQHPKANRMSEAQWYVVKWNAAWIAADTVDENGL